MNDSKIKSLVIAGLIILSLGITVNWFVNNRKTPTVSFNTSSAAVGASLSLVPASSNVAVNQTFTVDINLDSGSFPVSGVDIYKLNFNPSILEVVQVAATNLIPNTLINTFDNASGKIQLSQTTAGGSTFNGSGKIATITFKGKTVGSANVSFDFILGNTADTNVAVAGEDKLTSVSKGVFTVQAVNVSPTVKITAPNNSQVFIIPANVTINAAATDPDGSISKVEFYSGPTKLGEDASSPYSFIWSNVSIANTYSLTAKAFDNENASVTSTAVNIVVQTSILSRKVKLDFEGSRSKAVAAKLEVLNSLDQVLKGYNIQTDSLGEATVNIELVPQVVNLRASLPGFLKLKLSNVDLALNQTYALGKLLLGDLNGDNMVNSIDFSLLNGKWFSSFSDYDFNNDGIVNTIDFSFLNKNWNKQGN